MSGAKDEMMRWLEQVQEATGIAVRAGVLGRCEYHPDVLLDGGGDPEEAYKIANALFTAGMLRTHFGSRRELTDTVKAAIDEVGLDSCPRCDKLRAD